MVPRKGITNSEVPAQEPPLRHMNHQESNSESWEADPSDRGLTAAVTKDLSKTKKHLRRAVRIEYN